MMEGLKMADTELMVYIHPSKCGNVFNAVCRELSSLLFQFVPLFSSKYDETLDGVLLAFDFTMKSKGAKVLAGLNPYFGVKVESSLLLFNPKPNNLVEGKAVKLFMLQTSNNFLES
ncbi:hypothetical protein HID58_027846 [Brassica napus]|uniref:Uncharacterized protein n=1 Tax=Brassica napus TaxID=3708 RepID=A0ABQ8CT08_BRANA|nr:hypothetical protein HID58_027846 [Brassica napus]